jgi:hypothetical protein
MAIPFFAQGKWFQELGFATAGREWRQDRTSNMIGNLI